MNDSYFTTETMRADDQPRSAPDHTARPRRNRFLALGFATGALTLGACAVNDSDSADPEIAFRTSLDSTGPESTGPESTGPESTGPEESTTGEPQEPTTGETTTGEPNSTSPGEGSAPVYGHCGWRADPGYYSCGGTPGQADPSGTHPIDCPDSPPGPGEACGEINVIGCCTPTGVNYFCLASTGTVVTFECAS